MALGVGSSPSGKAATAPTFSCGRRSPTGKVTVSHSSAAESVWALERLNGAKLYVGRLGRLHAKHLPYQWLTTGCPSVVRNELVNMDESTQTQLQNSSSVVYDVHCTLGLVLVETKDWLQRRSMTLRTQRSDTWLSLHGRRHETWTPSHHIGHLAW